MQEIKTAPGGEISSTVVAPQMKSVSKHSISLYWIDHFLWLQHGVATDVDPVVVEGRAE